MRKDWLLEKNDVVWTWSAYSIAIQNAKVVRKVVVLDGYPDLFQIHRDKDYIVSASSVVFFPDGYFDLSHLLAAQQGGE